MENPIPDIPSSNSVHSGWSLRGRKIPKTKIVFFSQVVLIYIVVLTSIVNISLGSTQQLWFLLLSSCLGYLLPSPSLKFERTQFQQT